MPRWPYLASLATVLALATGCCPSVRARPKEPTMETRNNGLELPAVKGVPASMFEGTFGREEPSAARLQEWGSLAVALLQAGRGDLLELPVIDDIPFAPLPPDADASAADDGQPCCGAGEPGEPETPTFDVIGSVQGIQERLVWLGFFNGPVTSTLDAPTRSAIKAFQEAASLPISGYPDQATRDALLRRTIW